MGVGGRGGYGGGAGAGGGRFGWVHGLILTAGDDFFDLLATEATAHLDLFCTAHTNTHTHTHTHSHTESINNKTRSLTNSQSFHAL